MESTVTRGAEVLAPPPRARRRARAAGALLALAIATAAIGRFVLVGRGDEVAAVAPSAAAVATSPSALEARVSADPTDAPAWGALARAHLSEAIATSDPAAYDATERALATAERLRPGDESDLVTRATLQLSLHDFAAARSTAERAVSADGNDAAALAALVDARVETGAYTEAASALQRLLDVNPGAPALARLSYVRELHGDLAGAELAMTQAVAAASADVHERATLLTLLADLRLGAGDAALALAGYEQALALVPHLVTAELGRGRALAATGRLTDAIGALQAAVDRSPQPALASLLTDIATATGDTTTAEHAAELVRASEQLLAAAGVRVDLESAIFEADHGDPSLAVDRARAAYDARATVFTADALGWALTRDGRAAEAQPYVDESLRLGTPTASLRVHAAIARDAVGDRDGAVANLTAAFTRSAWTAPAVRAQATALADRIGVAVPSTWRP